MCLYTREEMTNREMIDLEKYNSAIKYKKIKLTNLENPYLFYDAIDKNEKFYEFKQLNHYFGDFDIKLCPRSKLRYAENKKFRLIYHFSKTFKI